MSSVEVLLKRKSSGAVILGEDPREGCCLITTCVLNMIFSVITCYWGHQNAKFIGACFAADFLVKTDQFLV